MMTSMGIFVQCTGMIFLVNQITVATIEQCLSEPTLLKVNI